jgi:vacuolar-type H+-ATPase subunit I/STV1
MLIISLIALADASAILYIINFSCNEEVADIIVPMNIFFGIITALIVWIIGYQVKEYAQ